VNVAPEPHSDYHSDTPVFRAAVVDGFDKSTATTVALKFAMREDLIDDLDKEAAVYAGALQHLQGTVIPRCYGLYTGSGEGGQPIACLVLEHCGECIQERFQYLPLSVRIRILERLADIHRCGLCHGDFAERNVLQRDGDIRIIDFDQTNYHNCDCDMNFYPGGKSPDAEEFGCHELWEVCRSELMLWDSELNSDDE